MLEGEERWEQQLAFHDRLRNDDRLMKQYAQLKLELSKRFKDDREAYTEAKTSFNIGCAIFAAGLSVYLGVTGIQTSHL
jgi:GrpB-like predicted nucleotidyltransferase (UPF0157 family)